jgi:GMP synthase (glutamine-hydrolysing)
MSGKVLQIIQMESARDDRVSRWLTRHGYELDRRLAANGDPLPSARADYDAVVVYGGPQSANEAGEKPYLQDEIDFIRDWTARDRPFLGLCLGAQLLARAYDGKVERHPEGLHEIGYVEVTPTPAGRDLFPAPMHVYHWHNEGFEVPDEGELLAEGPVYPNQAFRIGDNAYGLQFHPETTVPIFTSWMAEAGHMLDAPGAQPREEQFRLATRHDAPLAEWLDDFMSRLLNGRSG